MRFIGGKALLLKNIETVINENTDGSENVFCDIFAGSAAVAKHFKPRYEILSNDIMYFSYVLQKASIEINETPRFEGLSALGICDPVKYLETTDIINADAREQFILNNYSPSDGCERMYLQPQNAARIDFIRSEIERWKNSGALTDDGYYYLLSSLIDGVPYVSNITGTYGAYLKHWDRRSYERIKLVAPYICDNRRRNMCYNEDANKLVKLLEGDIIYIDPPYNNRQYAPNYHLLETIAKYDKPPLHGVTGMRPYNDLKSAYCIKGEAAEAFDDLISNAKFSNIVLSYGDDGIIPVDQIEGILKKRCLENTFKRYDIPYRKYKSKIVKPCDGHFEHIFFIKKHVSKPAYFFRPSISNASAARENNRRSNEYIKSPLNYIGGKFKLLPQIMPLFPKNIHTFVDLFCGGANVAINVNADVIHINDINAKLIDMFRAFKQTSPQEILSHISRRIDEFGLSKTNERGFLDFRDYYNETGDPVDLYTLSCYSFNYQLRFNSELKYNNPFGRYRSRFSDRMRANLLAFLEKLHTAQFIFSDNDFTNFDVDSLACDDFVYCDPPYLITTGSYNDGKRGFKDWTENEERQLLDMLDRIDRKGVRFALSNVLFHKGRENKLIDKWRTAYRVTDIDGDYSNSSYNTDRGHSREVLITNY